MRGRHGSSSNASESMPPPASAPLSSVSVNSPQSNNNETNHHGEAGHHHDVSPARSTSLPPLSRNPTTNSLSTTIQPLSPPAPASPTAISTALLVSSFSKLFPILLVIWGPGGTSNIPESGSHEVSNSQSSSSSHIVTSTSTPADPSAANGSGGTMWLSPFFFQDLGTSLTSWLMTRSTSWSYLGNCLELMISLISLGAADTHLVLLNNVEALYILLGCGYFRASVLAISGQMVRWMVQKLVLGTVLVEANC